MVNHYDNFVFEFTVSNLKWNFVYKTHNTAFIITYPKRAMQSQWVWNLAWFSVWTSG